jgi:hypothetical protein
MTMPIVCGVDIHRKQLTFDYLDTMTRQVVRGQVAPAELGSLESGVVGALTTPVISALSGGLLTVAMTVVIGVALPAFRRYRTERGPGSRPETDPGPEATSPPSAVPG